ncbi:unnamed protein product [Rhizoctonia solani]|uniref:Uncharacterized protein n=1 Tax=Rhizoctonia solani TaxID=456999 RepID=A0A8H3HBZ3_9AGAM|nr:unnamed protein product [Rhizoctonia solani]
MPSYGGFYVSPNVWRAWAAPRNPPYKGWGSTAVEEMIHKALWDHGIGELFRVTIVPVPKSEPEDKDWAVMVYTKRNSKKPLYFLQRPDSNADLNGKQMLQDIIGLETTDWVTVWYDGNSTTKPFDSQFTQPLITGKSP